MWTISWIIRYHYLFALISWSNIMDCVKFEAVTVNYLLLNPFMDYLLSQPNTLSKWPNIMDCVMFEAVTVNYSFEQFHGLFVITAFYFEQVMQYYWLHNIWGSDSQLLILNDFMDYLLSLSITLIKWSNIINCVTFGTVRVKHSFEQFHGLFVMTIYYFDNMIQYYRLHNIWDSDSQLFFVKHFMDYLLSQPFTLSKLSNIIDCMIFDAVTVNYLLWTMSWIICYHNLSSYLILLTA